MFHGIPSCCPLAYWLCTDYLDGQPEFHLDTTGGRDVGVQRKEKAESSFALEWDTLSFDTCEFVAMKKADPLYS